MTIACFTKFKILIVIQINSRFAILVSAGALRIPHLPGWAVFLESKTNHIRRLQILGASICLLV
jgi:hypothetical protein